MTITLLTLSPSASPSSPHHHHHHCHTNESLSCRKKDVAIADLKSQLDAEIAARLKAETANKGVLAQIEDLRTQLAQKDKSLADAQKVNAKNSDDLANAVKALETATAEKEKLSKKVASLQKQINEMPAYQSSMPEEEATKMRQQISDLKKQLAAGINTVTPSPSHHTFTQSTPPPSPTPP